MYNCLEVSDTLRLFSKNLCIVDNISSSKSSEPEISISSSTSFLDKEIPPTGKIRGVDLVTEGVITLNKVLDYAKNYDETNSEYFNWSFKQDGASQITRQLFEEATDINFFVGCAINPAHQG